MKKNILDIFSETNHKISQLRLIRNGETSSTYFGYFNNKKSIFESQIYLYIHNINENKNNKILKEGIKLYTKLKNNKFDNVVSHNDLNNSNILFNNYEVRFIDYDYLSINDRFCDLARICSSYKFSKTDIEVFLESYGLDCSKNNLDILKSWQLLNSYIDVIWFYFIKESDLNFFSQNQMVAKAKKSIKQQKQ